MYASVWTIAYCLTEFELQTFSVLESSLFPVFFFSLTQKAFPKTHEENSGRICSPKTQKRHLQLLSISFGPFQRRHQQNERWWHQFNGKGHHHILEDFCKTFEVFFIFQGPEPSESFGFEKRRLWKRSAKTSCRKRVAILHFLFTNYSPRMELLGYKWSIEFLNPMLQSFKF